MFGIAPSTEESDPVLRDTVPRLSDVGFDVLEVLWNLMQGMLKLNPDLLIFTTQAKQHPYFDGFEAPTFEEMISP